jgi:hypothetical protein
VSRPPRDPDDNARLKSDGRLDPGKLDAAKRPKRKRKARKLPDPPAELRQWEKAAEKRALARPYPPGIILEPAGFDEEHWTAPHSDPDLHTLQLADCFGTRSRAVFVTFMQQLEALCGKSHWDEEARQWRTDEHEFSASLAIINALKPRNELEAAHAAQMVAVHLMTMKAAARALRYDSDTRTAAVAGKLARTFTAQREAFERIRKPNRTAKQSIKVTKELHQHVHYYTNTPGGSESDGQPHDARAATVESSAQVPGDEQGGKVLRLPSRSRPRRV